MCCNTGRNRMSSAASMLATKSFVGLLSRRKVHTRGSAHKFIIPSWQ